MKVLFAFCFTKVLYIGQRLCSVKIYSVINSNFNVSSQVGDMPTKLRLGTYRKQRTERSPDSYVVSLPFTAAPLCNARWLDRRITAIGGPPHGKLLAS